jgi:hypothetical protein
LSNNLPSKTKHSHDCSPSFIKKITLFATIKTQNQLEETRLCVADCREAERNNEGSGGGDAAAGSLLLRGEVAAAESALERTVALTVDWLEDVNNHGGNCAAAATTDASAAAADRRFRRVRGELVRDIRALRGQLDRWTKEKPAAAAAAAAAQDSSSQ